MRLGTCLPDAPGTRLRMRLQDVLGNTPGGHSGGTDRGDRKHQSASEDVFGDAPGDMLAGRA